MFTFSENATSALKQAAAAQGFSEIRISVESAGCSGYRYGIAIDPDKADGDMVLSVAGVSIRVDFNSFSLLEGATVDYSPEGEGGFIFNNPKAKAKVSCGCGGGGGH